MFAIPNKNYNINNKQICKSTIFRRVELLKWFVKAYSMQYIYGFMSNGLFVLIVQHLCAHEYRFWGGEAFDLHCLKTRWWMTNNNNVLYPLYIIHSLNAQLTSFSMLLQTDAIIIYFYCFISYSWSVQFFFYSFFYSIFIVETGRDGWWFCRITGLASANLHCIHMNIQCECTACRNCTWQQ